MFLRISIMFPYIMLVFFGGIQKINATGIETAFYQDLQVDRFMKKWLVLGPIPVPQSKLGPLEQEAFAFDFLKDHGGESAIHPIPGSTCQVESKEYQWQFIHSAKDIVNLIDIYDENEFVLAYAWADIEMPGTTKAILGIGSDDSIKVWLNGKLVHQNWISRPPNKDDDLVPVTFQKGKNQLLLKIQNGVGGWGFACRMLSATTLAEKLVSASEQRDLGTLKLLLSHGVDVNTENSHDLTAMHMAKIRKHEDVIRFLTENGANPSVGMPPNERFVDYLFAERDKTTSPGCALAVIRDGEIIYKRGYGMANLEHDVPISSTTVFRIASTSKQFTAMSIALLIEQKKISLDDDIRKYLPEMPEYDSPITIGHLIYHISGIRDYFHMMSLSGMRYGDFCPDDEVFEMLTRQKELNFAPGDEYSYSNSGYFLLSIIVKRATGQSLREYAEENIFQPLGMKDTHFHDDHTMVVKNRATGYSLEVDYGENTYRINTSNLDAVGDDGVFTTVEDLFLWDQNFYDSKLGGRDLLTQVLTPGTLNNGKKVEYAFGLFVSEYKGLNTISHDGWCVGYSSEMIQFPEQKFSVVLLCNLNSINPNELARKVADICLSDEISQEPKAKPVEEMTAAERIKPFIPDSKQLMEFVGDFYSEELDTTYVLVIQEGQLTVKHKRHDDVMLTPTATDQFGASEWFSGIDFTRDVSGQVTGFRLAAGRIKNLRFEKQAR